MRPGDIHKKDVRVGGGGGSARYGCVRGQAVSHTDKVPAIGKVSAGRLGGHALAPPGWNRSRSGGMPRVQQSIVPISEKRNRPTHTLHGHCGRVSPNDCQGRPGSRGVRGSPKLLKSGWPEVRDRQRHGPSCVRVRPQFVAARDSCPRQRRSRSRGSLRRRQDSLPCLDVQQDRRHLSPGDRADMRWQHCCHLARSQAPEESEKDALTHVDELDREWQV